MTNAVYAKGGERVWAEGIGTPLKAVLVKNTYVLDLVAHEFASDVLSHAVSDVMAMANVTYTNGALDADDVTFTGVTSGDTCLGIVVFRDTGVAGTSPLMLWIDEIATFPMLTNGVATLVRWDSGANKIVSL